MDKSSDLLNARVIERSSSERSSSGTSPLSSFDVRRHCRSSSRHCGISSGVLLNTEIRTAELVYAGQEIEITETSASFYNERQKAAVSLNKVLEQNAKFGIGGSNPCTI